MKALIAGILVGCALSPQIPAYVSMIFFAIIPYAGLFDFFTVLTFTGLSALYMIPLTLVLLGNIAGCIFVGLDNPLLVYGEAHYKPNLK